MQTDDRVTDEDMVHMSHPNQRVHVVVGDDGWLVSAFRTHRSRAWRCVVEDDNGRLFIHNSGNLRVIIPSD
jgi:hypothetical protein